MKTDDLLSYRERYINIFKNENSGNQNKISSY